MQPEIPPDDEARAAAVRALGLLDQPADERFDRITRIARAAFDVPIAYVSLIDEGRQWILSCVGLEQGSSLDRGDSMCAHAVGAGRTLVTADARVDPRFADNPAVTGPPHAVFYAGHVLRDPLTRHVVGTLCLIDTTPRELDADDLARLDDLGGWVEAELARAHLAGMVERLEEERAHVARLSEERARLLASLVEGVVGMDADGRVVEVNPAVSELLGWGRGDLLGQRLHDLAHGSHADGTPHPWEECPVRQTLADGRPRQVAGDRFVRADGSMLPVDLLASPIVEDGRTVGAVVTLVDATPRLEAEQHRRAILSTVSHEMRTPLTSIKGSLSLLEAGVAGELPDRADELLHLASANTARLVRLVTDLVDVERWEHGHVCVVRAPHRLREVVDRAVASVRVLVDDAGLELRTEVGDHEVLVDADRIEQVLVNLLGNAVKFSDAGGTITVAASAGSAGVQVDVTDQGVGIPPERLASVFARFEQVDAAGARERLGSGLGLAIARGIVEAHGGRIWVDSRLGEGTRFHLTLPGTDDLDVPAAVVTADGARPLRLVEAVPLPVGDGPAVVLELDDARRSLLDEVLRADGARVVATHRIDDLATLASGVEARALVVSGEDGARVESALAALGERALGCVLLHGAPGQDEAALLALGERIAVRLEGR